MYHMYTFIFYRENQVSHKLNVLIWCVILSPTLRCVAGDFKRNDDVYDALDDQKLGEVHELSVARIARSIDVMSKESLILREIMNKLI